MEVFNVIGLGGHFTLYSSMGEIIHSITSSQENNTELSTQLVELLSYVPESKKVNLILDERWIQFHHLQLPFFPRSRILKLLQFELEQHLFSNVSEYTFIPKLTPDKVNKTTFVNVYSMRNESLAFLRELIYDAKIDLARIIPLTSLIDLFLQQTYSIENNVVIYPFSGQLRMFCYSNGVLNNISLIPLLTAVGQETETTWVQVLNQRISAFLMHDKAETELILHGLDELEVIHNNVHAKSNFSALSVENAGREEINNDEIVSSRLVTNMQERRTIILAQLSKFKSSFIKIGIALGIILIMYTGTLVYKNILIDKQVKQAEQGYTSIMRRYLSPRVSIDESIPFLTKALKQHKSSQAQQFNPFFKGKYPALRLWERFSLLKSQFPDLQLISIVQNAREIKVSGKIQKKVSVDKLKTILAKQFSKQNYSIKVTTQKQKKLYFLTITINLKQKSER